MEPSKNTESQRKRAPSQRSLATRERILNAAENVFATKGFDGATIRDIADTAGEPIGSVHHHGRGKDMLFHQVVARRAETLSELRYEALEALGAADRHSAHALLRAFMLPLFDLCQSDPRWTHYARIVALVSTDTRWQALTETYFDPTFAAYMEHFARLLPKASRTEIAEAFVYCVSAMLALLTTQGRISELGGEPVQSGAQFERLVGFCASGFMSLRANSEGSGT